MLPCHGADTTSLKRDLLTTETQSLALTCLGLELCAYGPENNHNNFTIHGASHLPPSLVPSTEPSYADAWQLPELSLMRSFGTESW